MPQGKRLLHPLLRVRGAAKLRADARVQPLSALSLDSLGSNCSSPAIAPRFRAFLSSARSPHVSIHGRRDYYMATLGSAPKFAEIATLGSIPKRADFTRKPHDFLIRQLGVTRLAARAALCSEARARPGAEAVPSQGTRGPSVAKNLMRRFVEAGQDKSQNMLMYLMSMVLGVVGVTYASVPLYRRFCQATGFGGTVQERQTVDLSREIEDVRTARELVVHFSADVADSMPWKFTPCQSQVKVKVGQSVLAFYTAENTSLDSITGVSTYNVAPMQAGQYFTKIQCFCFEEQRLRPGEKIDMPVLFYVDPDFAADPKMDTINSLILSYTFFKVEEDEDES